MSHQALTVTDMSAAAALVADVAANERAVTMQHADCDSYRWVRVQAPQRVSDLLVAAAQEERGCQAELIAH
jgi:predicted nicotinamide N-methyase